MTDSLNLRMDSLMVVKSGRSEGSSAQALLIRPTRSAVHPPSSDTSSSGRNGGLDFTRSTIAYNGEDEERDYLSVGL